MIERKEDEEMTWKNSGCVLRWKNKSLPDTEDCSEVCLFEAFGSVNYRDLPRDISYGALENNWHNLLFHGDNKYVLTLLLQKGFRGKIKLVYIDPPFKSGVSYLRKVEIRGIKNMNSTLDKSSIVHQPVYSDTWKDDEYLQFMYERLILLRDLLMESGSIYVHVDWHFGHYIKVMMDEIFGRSNFINQIIWRKTNSPKAQSKGFGTQHDIILVYARNKDEVIFNKIYRKIDKNLDEDYLGAFRYDDNDGRGPYQTVPLIAGGIQRSDRRRIFEFRGVKAPWLYSEENLEHFWKENRIVKTKEGLYRLKVYLKDIKGREISDLWVDREVNPLQGQSMESTGFVTQKPESLLERIIKASSESDDIVLDCFIGSGTTAKVAQKLSRKWIGCDISKVAIHLTRRRVQQIITEQMRSGSPNYPSFMIYRVNNPVKLHPEKENSAPDVSMGYPHENVKISVRRINNKVRISIEDFKPKEIIDRVKINDGAEIFDFRCFIDCVLIDDNYDGKVFCVKYSDIPRERKDLIKGEYLIGIAEHKTSIAVKIVDIFGEETIVGLRI